MPVLSSAVKEQTPTSSKEKRHIEYLDQLVQGTNNSSIVSKRPVERIYTNVLNKEKNGGKPIEFFRHFVKKPQRRSPVINRGYWIRMEAISRSIEKVGKLHFKFYLTFTLTRKSYRLLTILIQNKYS